MFRTVGSRDALVFVACSFLLHAGFSVCCGAPLFESAFQTYETSGTFTPYDPDPWGAAAAGDFDRDGHKDLAVANGGDLSVLRGIGDGTFGDRRDVPTHGTARAVAVGDFNEDLEPDLACTNGDSAVVIIIVGDGYGGFTVGPERSLPGNGSAIEVADFNKDRHKDIAITIPLQDAVAVLLGNGDGTFRGFTSFNVGDRPSSLVAGDVNADGLLDLVVANLGSAPGQVSNVSVLIGNGDGTFRSQTTFVSGLGSAGISLADLDGDHDLDLVVANSGNQAPLPGSIAVLKGRGDGSFESKLEYQTESLPNSVEAADFNGDGRLDVAAACFYKGQVSVLVGNGDGSFQASRSYPVAAYPTSIAVADLDENHSPDLVIASPSTRSVCIVLGNGDASFGQADRLSTSLWPHSTAVGDIDEDGLEDIVSTITAFYQDPDSLSIQAGRAGRTFAPEVTVPCGFSPTSVTLADVDGDGHLDALVSLYGYAPGFPDSGSVGVLLGAGNGSFASMQQYPVGLQPYGIAVADFEHDGKMDVATANAGSTTVSVLRGLGDGSFGSQDIYDVGFNPRWIATSDVNGDGYADLLTVSLRGLVVLIGRRDGKFDVTSQPVSWNPNEVTTGDWNMDGNIDLAISHSGPDIISILMGNGDGSFRQLNEIDVPGAVWVLRPGDIDRDGRLDLVGAAYPSGSIAFMKGNGDGSFSAGVGFGGGLGPYSVAIGDVDNDGWPDLVVPNIGEQSIAVLWNRGGIIFPSPPSINALAQNFPNPFNPQTVIRYDLATGGRVQIRVYDVSGRRVRSLLDADKPAGSYSVRWSGELDSGGHASSGIYFYRITYPDGAVASRKMTLVR